MIEYIKQHRVWFLIGGVSCSMFLTSLLSIFIILKYGDPIGTELQYLGAKFIAAGQPAIIERQSNEDIAAAHVEEAIKPVLAEKEELEAKLKVIDSQRVSCETILDGNTRRALVDAKKRIGG